MKLTMKVQIAGSRNGVRWPEAGSTVDLPDNEAEELIAARLAEPFEGECEPETCECAPETPEEPVEAPQEAEERAETPEEAVEEPEVVEPETRPAPKPSTRNKSRRR